MRIFFGTVLSVIAVGVLLIAYGLLSPRVLAAPVGSAAPDARGNWYQPARRLPVNDIVSLNDDASYGRYGAPSAYPMDHVRPAYAYRTYAAPRGAAAETRVVRSRGRNWKRTALVIGGSTAAGAGLGALFAGEKGALIGAAIGGGASGPYEATKR
jgi:hypothetical protein